MKYVVDASVAVKWFVEEERREWARKALGSKFRLFAPDLLFVEVANAFRNKVRLGLMVMEQARTASNTLEGLFDDVIDSRRLIGDAFELACVLNHPVADCIYLACGARLDAPVLTDDDILIKKAASLAAVPSAISLNEFGSARFRI